MAPTYSHTDPTPAELALFVATYPPILGAEGTPGAPPAAAEGAGGGQGEGAAGPGGDVYDSYVERVPAELREQVAPILRDALKEADGNATRKFQEVASFREKYQPYDELGVGDIPPDTMETVLNWLEMSNDPEQYKAWVQSQAQALGIGQAGAAGGGDPAEYGLDDLDGDLPPEQRPVTRAELDQFRAELQGQRELESQQEQTTRELEQRFESLSAELGINEFDPKVRERHENAIWSFAQTHYANDKDPVGKAFEHYKELIGQTETDLLRKKLAVPAPPEGGGGAPDTAVARPKTIAEAGALMRERLRQQQAA